MKNAKTKRLLRVLMISFAWLCCLVLYEVQKKLPSDISQLTARSEDRAINLSWENPQISRDGTIELTVESCENVTQVRLKPGTTEYAFLDGSHGEKYRFSVRAKNSEGYLGEGSAVSALFLDMELLPDLPLVQIETADGKNPTTDYIGPPKGAFGQGLITTIMWMPKCL